MSNPRTMVHNAAARSSEINFNIAQDAITHHRQNVSKIISDMTTELRSVFARFPDKRWNVHDAVEKKIYQNQIMPTVNQALLDIETSYIETIKELRRRAYLGGITMGAMEIQDLGGPEIDLAQAIIRAPTEEVRQDNTCDD